MFSFAQPARLKREQESKRNEKKFFWESALFSKSLVNFLAIFSCYPGDRKKLFKAIVGHSLLPNVLSLIEFVVRNRFIEKDKIVIWRDNITKLYYLNKEKEICCAIGALTLYSNKVNHIAYVTDGNRRWAVQKGLALNQAHKQAFVIVIPRVAEQIFKYGVHTFSIWQFKEKNLLTRSKEEVVESILKYLIEALKVYLKMAKELNIRIFRIGNRCCAHSDKEVQYWFQRMIEMFDVVERETSHFDKHYLVIGANYEREDDILRAIKKMHLEKINLNTLKAEDIIKFTDVGKLRYPCPDLFIRSAMPGRGGRMGGFLPVTSEACIYFTPKLAPEFSIEDVILGAAKLADPLNDYKSDKHFVKGIPSIIKSKL